MEISPETLIFARDFIIFFAIYLTVALSLNLEYGYAGVPNFGKVFSVAAGAFVVGSIPGRIVAWLFNIGPGLDYINDNTAIVTGINQVLAQDPATSVAIFFVTLAVAGAVGAILGLVSCYPAIKLREDYLAITLLAMGEAIQVIGYNYRPIIKGSMGVLVPDPFRWAADLRYAVFAVFIVGICVLVLYYLERSVRSPLGRMLRAIRDNENVAESLGKDVTRVRMKTIIIAAAIGSIAGADRNVRLYGPQEVHRLLQGISRPLPPFQRSVARLPTAGNIVDSDTDVQAGRHRAGKADTHTEPQET